MNSHSEGDKETKAKPNIDNLDEEKAEVTRQDDDPGESSSTARLLQYLPDVEWIKAKLDWGSLQPVIRSAVSAWICLIIILVSGPERVLGQAGFLALIASFMSPPSDPFMAVVERQLAILLFTTTAWAWSCLGIKLANLGRQKLVPNASVQDIFAGVYIEAVPSVICGVFLFTGSGMILFLKSKLGPGPFVFATVLSCVCLDISLTTAALFPYPYYAVGQLVVIPLAVQTAAAIACAALIFPQSVNAQFLKRLRAILLPLKEAISEQPRLLSLSPLSDEFISNDFTKKLSASEAGFPPIAASARLMKREFSWGRLNGEDLAELQDITRRLFLRCHGMNFFFSIIDTNRGKLFLGDLRTPLDSASNTPKASRPPTPDTPNNDAPGAIASSVSISSSRTAKHRHHFPRVHVHFNTKSFQDAQEHSHENLVGVFESQKYLDLEARLTHPEAVHLQKRALSLLAKTTTPLLVASVDGLEYVTDWLDQLNSLRLRVSWLPNTKKRRTWEENLNASQTALDNLTAALQIFKERDRLGILDPYRSQETPLIPGPTAAPHRFLFNSFVYQYHLIQFADGLREFLTKIVEFEKERKQNRLWMPGLPLVRILSWESNEAHEEVGAGDRGDEDPDVIPGIESKEDFGEVAARDPDALPPSNPLEVLGSWIHGFLVSFRGGNAVFGLKAAVLSILLSLPTLFRKTSGFAYENKFVWAIFMGQLTLSRFRGDTTFGLVARVFATFFGGLMGMVIWYIASGSGRGNPFGLAAVCTVAFPIMIFGRLYYPGPPMTAIIFFVTIALIVGYSWQDNHLPSPSSPGTGWDVAWRRFVLVTTGVVGAFLFSFLPPSTTIRHYQRRTYARTVTELGSICCRIVSFANTGEDGPHNDHHVLVKDILAVRAKLKKSLTIQTNIGFEISVRGKWPKERYASLLKTQLEISYLLGHLASVIHNLEPAWSLAFLRRSRFLDTDFQGDVLAVITMISDALRTGRPLPQITPGPLLDRFLQYQHGLNIMREEVDDDYGLPRTVTISTLENEQYMYFCVGVASAYSIVNRLDRLMVATKQLVGEHFHIHGLGTARVRIGPDVDREKEDGTPR